MERRDRLRKLLATMDDDAADGLIAQQQEQQQPQDADAAATAKVFYTEGSASLKEARMEACRCPLIMLRVLDAAGGLCCRSFSRVEYLVQSAAVQITISPVWLPHLLHTTISTYQGHLFPGEESPNVILQVPACIVTQGYAMLSQC